MRPGESNYALENQQRQAEWEPGFRQRIEHVINEIGGPGKVQRAAHIKSQTLQKIRRGGSRLCFLTSFIEATGVNATWLLLGGFSEPRWRTGHGMMAELKDERLDEVDGRPRRADVDPETDESKAVRGKRTERQR